jgi:hypothetical protein
MALPLRQIVIGGAILCAVAFVVGTLRRERRHSENLLEKGLEDTFPASDATATQDFAIPANRQ